MLFSMLLSFLFLVTEAQYPYNRDLYQRQQQRNEILQAPIEASSQPAAILIQSEYLPVAAETRGLSISQLIRVNWENIIPYMKLMLQHPQTAPLIEEMVEVNPCVDSLEAYLKLLEQRVLLMEIYSPAMEEMFAKILSLRGEKDVGNVLSTSADILNDMDPILSKFIKSFTCMPLTEVGVKAMRDLAINLYKQSQLNDIPNIITPSVKNNLFWAARITEAASNIIDHFSKNLARKDCYTSKDGFGDFIDVLSATIEDIAEGFGAFQYFEGAKELRQYAQFARSLKDSLGVLPDFKMKGNCKPGALKRNAAVIKEVSNIVKDEGLDTLFLETGVTFRVDLLP